MSAQAKTAPKTEPKPESQMTATELEIAAGKAAVAAAQAALNAEQTAGTKANAAYAATKRD